MDANLASFPSENYIVTVCENQAWGSPECITKTYFAEFSSKISRKFVSKEVIRLKDLSKINYSLEIGGKDKNYEDVILKKIFLGAFGIRLKCLSVS